MIASGVLLPPTGYVFEASVRRPVYLSLAKTGAMVVAATGAIAMWALVHHAIWPNLQVVLGQRPGNAEAKAAARAKVALYARTNLLLAIPVTVLMVAAAHLF